jgi:hypothetical protein
VSRMTRPRADESVGEGFSRSARPSPPWRIRSHNQFKNGMHIELEGQRLAHRRVPST